MSLFARPEVIILKESSDAKEYLSKLEKRGTVYYQETITPVNILKE